MEKEAEFLVYVSGPSAVRAPHRARNWARGTFEEAFAVCIIQDRLSVGVESALLYAPSLEASLALCPPCCVKGVLECKCELCKLAHRGPWVCEGVSSECLEVVRPPFVTLSDNFARRAKVPAIVEAARALEALVDALEVRLERGGLGGAPGC